MSDLQGYTPPSARWWTSGIAIVVLHAVGWGLLISVVGVEGGHVKHTVFGLGLTAYLLGVRHAFDADHIAMIDNVIRRVTNKGVASYNVGLWFSLGHSFVVLALVFLVALGAGSFAGALIGKDSGARDLADVVGTVTSSFLLLSVAIVNVPMLARSWVGYRATSSQPCELPQPTDPKLPTGMLSHLVNRLGRLVSRPWHMLAIGLLFGLGFDTATEITLLLMGGASPHGHLWWPTLLCLPMLFAAGMSLFDSLDAHFMAAAYSWSVRKPRRRIKYNLVVTAISVCAAVVISLAQILDLLSQHLRSKTPLLNQLQLVDPTWGGWALVCIFAVAWLVAALNLWPSLLTARHKQGQEASAAD